MNKNGENSPSNAMTLVHTFSNNSDNYKQKS